MYGHTALRIRHLPKPDLQVGDKVYLCDGSSLACLSHEVDWPMIIKAYPEITGSHKHLKDCQAKIISMNNTEYVSLGSCNQVYMLDTYILIGNSLWATCSKFLTKDTPAI